MTTPPQPGKPTGGRWFAHPVLSVLLFAVWLLLRQSAQPVDVLFGAVFGLARGLALLLVAAVLVSLTPARQATWWTESTGARWLDQALLELHPWLPLPGGKEQSV